MVNVHVVVHRLGKLREYLALLKRIRMEPRDKFIKDPLVYGNAERYLQLAIQAIIDIGNHIIADRKLKEPEEYRDIMNTLGQAGIIPGDLAKRLLPLVGLRNILVHEYTEIDHARLYDALHNELSDLEGFAEHIGKLI